MRKKSILFLLSVLIATTSVPVTQCFASGSVADESHNTPFDGQIHGDGSFDGEIDLELPSYVTPRVTAIHSGNATCKMLFNPTLDEYPYDLVSKVMKCSGEGAKGTVSFAAAYSGYWNAEVESASKQKIPSSAEGYKRELDILGEDILIRDEKVGFKKTSGRYTPYADQKWLLDENITTYDAYVATYKALGQYKYVNKIAFNSDDSLSLATSPISQYLNLLYNRDNFALDTTYGSTTVLITRSAKSAYKEQITKDSNLLDSLGVDGATEVTNPAPDNKAITLAEFCVYVKNLMQEYGEPIMTETEEAMLMQIYGKNLPYYISDDLAVGDKTEILSAIKYLIAKGILNPNRETPYDYTGKLTLGDMLQILAAVKDKDSRYTFKDIDITLDAELQELGYYETTLSGMLSPIQSMEVDTSASEYYDYLVKADEHTTFMLGSTAITDEFCLVSKKGKKLSSTKSGAFIFVGMQGDYYHFQIKAGTSYVKEYLYNGNYLKIATTQSGTSPKYYFVKFGGGTYDSSKGYKNKKLHRELFATSNEYIDSEKKKQMLTVATADSGVLKLAAGIPIRFSLSESTWKDDIKKIKWKENAGDDAKNAKALTDLTTDTSMKIGSYTITRDGVASKGLRYFSVEGCADLAEFRSHIVHENVGGRYNEYQTYCQNGENVLVNFDYLQDVGVAMRYIELDNEVVLLTTKTNNIYLCPKQKWVIVGNVIYDMPSDSLMYYKKDGKLFVDYRAAMGWAGDYYVFQENNGQITLSVPSRSNASTLYGTREIYTPMGGVSGSGKNKTIGSSLTVQIMDAPSTDLYDGILLSSTYPLANYFIFDGSESAGSSTGDTDYLFVFKMGGIKYGKGKKVSDLYKSDSIARDKLLELTGLEAPKDWLVYVYQLHKDKPKANPPGINYSEKFGYYYVPPVYSSKYKENYYSSCIIDNKKIKGTAKTYDSTSDIVLPFVQKNGKIYDINFNLFKIKGKTLVYGGAPYNYLRTDGSSSTKYVAYWKPGTDESTKSSVEYGTAIDAQIIPAPTGVIGSLASLSPLSSDVVIKSSYSVYLGTMKAGIYIPTAQSAHYSGGKDKPKLKIGQLNYGTIGEDPLTSFRILRSTSNGYILGTTTDDVLVATDEDRAATAEKPTIGAGLSLVGFDWEQFKFKNLVEDADDFITIATIALLNFLPRIAIFIFIGLIGLSLITNVRIWVLFCDNIFDVYKLFTFNRKDVHTIDTFTLFWTSILAIAAFGLFMDGTIINVIAWLVRAGAGIISR